MSSIVEQILPPEPQPMSAEALARQARFHIERAAGYYVRAAAQLRQDGERHRAEIAFSLAGVLQRMGGEMEDAANMEETTS